MSKKTIFLMGAPTLQSLRWDEDELLNKPIPPFEDEAHWPFSDSQSVKWRLLPTPTATGPPSEESQWSSAKVAAQFLTTRDLEASHGVPAPEPAASALSRFYDHSFTVHEESEVSVPGAYSGDSMQESGLWAESTGTSFATSSNSSSDQESQGVRLSIRGPVTDLRDIPSAAYLQTIVPQTMTVNLIVGVIAIHPPRRIVTRQWKKELDLVEVVVGDETRSGFGVTFWLPPAEEQGARKDSRDRDEGHELGQSLAQLRPQDIVLLRMVGLSSFRERVYGQSLRKGITQVDLLHRRRVDASDAGGMYSVRRLREVNQNAEPAAAKSDDLPLAKVSQVREWIRRFVDCSPHPVGGGARGTAQRGLVLPPDTQDEDHYN